MQRPFSAAHLSIPRWILAATLVGPGYVALASADSHTQFLVGATVRPIARIESLAAPSGFAVSDADVRRGYLVVTEPVRLRVYSNSRTGFALDVHNLATDMRGVQMSGLGPDVAVPDEGASIVQRWQQPQTVSLELRFRFMLPDRLAPGTYPWPLRLQVRPLTSPIQ
jgi:hypothetical protein